MGLHPYLHQLHWDVRQDVPERCAKRMVQWQEPNDWRYLPYIRPIYMDIPTKYGLIWYSTSILGSWNSHWSTAAQNFDPATSHEPKSRCFIQHNSPSRRNLWIPPTKTTIFIYQKNQETSFSRHFRILWHGCKAIRWNILGKKSSQSQRATRIPWSDGAPWVSPWLEGWPPLPWPCGALPRSARLVQDHEIYIVITIVNSG